MLDVDKFKGAVAEQGLNQRQLARLYSTTYYENLKRCLWDKAAINPT